MENEVDLEAVAREIKAEAEIAIAELRKVSGGVSVDGIKGLLAVTPKVVEIVQTIGAKVGLAGEDKKKLAVEIILSLVKLPAFVPVMIVRMLLNFLIERAVALVKKKLNGNA